MTIRSIGIAAKTSSPEALARAVEAKRELEERGLLVAFDADTVAALGTHAEAVPRDALGQGRDLLVTFGGDGTLLSVARHAPEGVPILGVNMGTLGFLAEVSLEEYPALMERVLAGDIETEERVVLDVTRFSKDGDRHFRAMNDAVINKGAMARIIRMPVTVGDRFVSVFRADGLIVSSPTGSTAYNLSAGGPIVFPTAHSLILTPISPHALTNRPLVLPDDQPIDIRIEPPHEDVYLTVDGQEGVELHEGDRVRVTRSAHPVTFVCAPGKNYFEVLRTKLRWGETG